MRSSTVFKYYGRTYIVSKLLTTVDSVAIDADYDNYTWHAFDMLLLRYTYLYG